MAISNLAASLGLHRLPLVEGGEGLEPVWFPGVGEESNDMEATSRSQTCATIRQITAKLPVTWQKIKWLIVVSAQDSHALLCQLLFTVLCGPTRIWLAIREVYCNVAVRHHQKGDRIESSRRLFFFVSEEEKKSRWCQFCNSPTDRCLDVPMII